MVSTNLVFTNLSDIVRDVGGYSKTWGQFLEAGDVVRDVMKRHRVLGEDRHVRFEERGIIHCADLHHENTGCAGRGGAYGSAAARAEVSGHGIFNISALE